MVDELGYTPYAALESGTLKVAEYFGTTKDTGTVAVGKRADLILVDEPTSALDSSLGEQVMETLRRHKGLRGAEAFLDQPPQPEGFEAFLSRVEV